MSYRQNASTMLLLSSCVVLSKTRISAVVPLDALPCSSCPLAVTFPGYAIQLLFGSANITIVASPRITAVNPMNLPIGSLPRTAVGGVFFPELPCRCVRQHSPLFNIVPLALAVDFAPARHGFFSYMQP